MKPNSHLITAACVAALVFCGPSIAFAASKKSDSASPSPAASASPATAKADAPAAKAPRAVPFKGTASAVDQSAKSFAVAGKEASRTFKATDKTIVTKEGKAATFADLVNDEKVTGSYWKQADGTLELKSLKIGGKGEAAPAKKGKKGDDAAAAASPSPSASPKK